MKDFKLTEGWKQSIIKCKELSHERRKDNIDQYNINPNVCSRCGIKLSYDKRINKFCTSRCAGYVSTKGYHHKKETKLKISESIKSSKIFRNNYKAYIESQEFYVDKQCPICNEKFIVPKWLSDRIFCSKSCFIFDQRNGHKYSKKATGGIRDNGGYGKSGRYKGIFCNSTYELVWVIYNLDHNIPFQKNTNSFEYIQDGKKHKYYPDFIQNDEYIEIKGFLRDSDFYKIMQFPYEFNIKILMGNDLKKEFKYVHDTYGKDLVSLYDKKMERVTEFASATTSLENLDSTN